MDFAAEIDKLIEEVIERRDEARAADSQEAAREYALVITALEDAQMRAARGDAFLVERRG